MLSLSISLCCIRVIFSICKVYDKMSKESIFIFTVYYANNHEMCLNVCRKIKGKLEKIRVRARTRNNFDVTK